MRLPQVRGARRGPRGAAERAASGARAAPPREAAGRGFSPRGRRRRRRAGGGGVLSLGGRVRRAGRLRKPGVKRDALCAAFRTARCVARRLAVAGKAFFHAASFSIEFSRIFMNVQSNLSVHSASS